MDALAEDGPARGEGGPPPSEPVVKETSEIRHAIPLAIAAALVGVVSLLTTVVVAHVLTSEQYGTLIALLALFLVVSMPGTALLVGVVRRVSAWQTSGLGDRVRPWVKRIHRIGEASIVLVAVVMFLIREPVSHALGLPSPSGVAEILTAGGVFILVSIDRGLLQVGRDYRDLSVNLVIEAVTRCVLTVGMAAAFRVEGAALGLLFAELITAGHARFTSTRAVIRGNALAQLVDAPTEPEVAIEETGGAVAMTVHGGKVLLADVLAALGSLLLLAILQNTDVIVLGSLMHRNSGDYAAISVPAKALVFVALVLVNYLLPEAAIRHQRGSHALRQLAHTLGVLAIPCAVLLALATFAPYRVLKLVFGPKLTAGAPSFSTLVLAMVFMSVTVALSIYLLGIGWRWVLVVLAVGAGALAAATYAAGGHIAATARADLAVQVGLCVVTTVCFVVVHRRSARRRAGVDGASTEASESVA